MFEHFETAGGAAPSRRFAASMGVSILVYASAAALFVVLGQRVREVVEEREVEVTFAAAPKPAAASAPVVEAPKAAPKPARAPQPTTLVQPTRIDSKPLEQADPVPEAAPQGDGGGEGAGTPVAGIVAAPPPKAAPPSPPPAPPPAAPAEPIDLPENATPAIPDPDNARPEYPEEARAKGLEGTVILRLVIGPTGAIERISVLRGEQMFVMAAINAVKTWKFTPAQVDGRGVRHFRIVKVPFVVRQ